MLGAEESYVDPQDEALAVKLNVLLNYYVVSTIFLFQWKEVVHYLLPFN